jgi:hypothetical protein
MKLTRRSLFWSLVAAFAFAGAAFAADSNDGFKPIFNGKDLKGWDGDPRLWSVQDGTIVGQTTPEKSIKTNTFLIWRDGAVDDFIIKFKFRMHGGNSGLQYRSKEFKDMHNWVVGGYQADMDVGNTYTGIMYEERGPRGIAAQRGQKVILQPGAKKEVVGAVGTDADIKAAIKNEEWNDYVITAQGNHIVQQINGKTTVDVTDNDEKNRAMSGILAFQLHVGAPMKVEFKDVMLKRLPLGSKKN